MKRLKQLRANKQSTRVDFPNSDIADFTCEVCILGKAHRAPIRGKERECATYPGECFHVDTCGPMQVSTVGGMWYLVMMVDCHSRKKFIILTEDKKVIKNKLKAEIFFTNSQLPPDKKVRNLHCDIGGEFINQHLSDFCKPLGIEITTSAAGTPEHNSVAERDNQTIVGAARCLLIAAGLPPRFWGDACQFATLVSNTSPC